MFSSLPKSALDCLDWGWEKYEPYYQELAERELNTGTLESWMDDWSRAEKLVSETYARLYVATTLDTKAEKAEKMFFAFLEDVYPNAKAAAQKLKEKLLESGLEVEDFEVQLRNMRAEAALFREANLPLLADEQKKVNAYDKVIGAQTVMWEGEEITLPKLRPVFQETDRAKREKAWRLSMERFLQDREAINDLWKEFMELRGQLAQNAGYASYRDYRWQELRRLDYTPEDCIKFDAAIEQVVVPAAVKVYEKRKGRLGVESLRPWDLDVDPLGRDPLRPYKEDWELRDKSSAIFHKVDPELGSYFDVMMEEDLLDLENRPGKAPGGYCIDFLTAKRPFIFMNAVGLHDDVQTLLHEAGHAFHVFETADLPYIQQMQYSMEIAEVASMSMELLSAPYLAESQGGFYSQADAARARIEHLESSLLFWPYMAVVDSFQHWVYENHEAASDPANCDAEWGKQWDRFMKGIEYSGLEDIKVTGWHRKLHIHEVPFYYVDYGLAQLGAVQVWANAQKDQAGAVKSYRKALSLGATRILPELFAAADVKLAFDAETLGGAVDLIMKTIEELEAVGE